MNKIIGMILILILIFGCIQEPTGKASNSIPSEEVQNQISSTEITPKEYQDINSSNKTNWWGLANYVPLLGN
ncbi:MAG: hypothetical protein JW703_00220 [Candidatus Diapherotrites archaeon]|nr:hypothetical protein [Candidatus Diapherotrites archaeon]